MLNNILKDVKKGDDAGTLEYINNAKNAALNTENDANKNKTNEKDNKNTLVDQIINRCRTQMGEYGAAMIKACVDEDLKALDSLISYPKSYETIINRCLSQMQEYGYSMVKACVEQDIKAEEELNHY